MSFVFLILLVFSSISFFLYFISVFLKEKKNHKLTKVQTRAFGLFHKNNYDMKWYDGAYHPPYHDVCAYVVYRIFSF